MCHGLLLTESAVGRTVPGSNRGQYIPSRPPLRLHLRHQDGQGGRHQGAKQLHPPLSSRPPLLFPTFEVNCIMVVAIINNHGIKQLSTRAGHAFANYAASCGYAFMRFGYPHVCFYFPNLNVSCAVSCKYTHIYEHIFSQPT